MIEWIIFANGLNLFFLEEGKIYLDLEISFFEKTNKSKKISLTYDLKKDEVLEEASGKYKNLSLMERIVFKKNKECLFSYLKNIIKNTNQFMEKKEYFNLKNFVIRERNNNNRTRLFYEKDIYLKSFLQIGSIVLEYDHYNFKFDRLEITFDSLMGDEKVKFCYGYIDNQLKINIRDERKKENKLNEILMANPSQKLKFLLNSF